MAEEVKEIKIQKHEKPKDLQLRSAAVEDIINRPPHWLLRWGITSVFLVVVLVLIASWVIKYPEIISGDAILVSDNPAIIRISKLNSKITGVLVEDGEHVEEATPLLSLENPLSTEEFSSLSEVTNAMNRSLFSSRGEIPDMDLDTNRNYGSLQPSYNNLAKALADYREYQSRHIDSVRLNNLGTQMNNYRRLAEISQRQIELARKEMVNAKEKYEADQKLYKEGVYSKMDFLEMETAYRSKLTAYESARQSATQYEITLADYQRQFEELKYNLNEEKRTLKLALINANASLQSEMENWQQNYLITADKKGQVNYLTNLFPGKSITAGEELLAIVPQARNFYATATIPSTNYGKVEKGQIVNIKLQNYNWQEYGMLKGQVETISSIPSQNGYRIKIKFIESQSRFLEEVQLKPEMKGMAEIQTKDLRLIERLFYQVKKLLERNDQSDLTK